VWRQRNHCPRRRTGDGNAAPEQTQFHRHRSAPVGTSGLKTRKRERVRCSSLVDWPVYPRLRRTMQECERARNSAWGRAPEPRGLNSVPQRYLIILAQARRRYLPQQIRRIGGCRARCRRNPRAWGGGRSRERRDDAAATGMSDMRGGAKGADRWIGDSAPSPSVPSLRTVRRSAARRGRCAASGHCSLSEAH
jgi:hypothetical protein